MHRSMMHVTSNLYKWILCEGDLGSLYNITPVDTLQEAHAECGVCTLESSIATTQILLHCPNKN
jgi:hypothetical protein